MLIEPASKVSVPFTLVMRILSNAPPSAGVTPPPEVALLPLSAKYPAATHVFDETSVKVIAPDKVFETLKFPNIIPVVEFPPPIDAGLKYVALLLYPDVETEPEPT